MKIVMRLCAMAMVLALMLCAVGCKKDKTAAAQTSTQATQKNEETELFAEDETTGSADETVATEATVATGTDETVASAPADSQEQPTGQEQGVEVDEELAYEDEFLWEDEIGIGPRITVKWETYEAMSEAEQAAYRACFTTENAFNEWEEMALMDYEISMDDELFMGYGTLNLKEIIESLLGEQIG